MRGRCMLILIWLVRKYKKTRERIQTVQMNLFGLFIFKSDVRCLPPLQVASNKSVSVGHS